MNFIPCRIEESGGLLQVCVGDTIALPIPPDRTARYRAIPRDTKLLLGLRPEHLVDAQSNPSATFQPFDATPDVVEPMGMETFVYFPLDGAQLCGRINPGIDAKAGAPLRLAVDLNHMHLLNETTGQVL